MFFLLDVGLGAVALGERVVFYEVLGGGRGGRGMWCMIRICD